MQSIWHLRNCIPAKAVQFNIIKAIYAEITPITPVEAPTVIESVRRQLNMLPPTPEMKNNKAILVNPKVFSMPVPHISKHIRFMKMCMKFACKKRAVTNNQTHPWAILYGYLAPNSIIAWVEGDKKLPVKVSVKDSSKMK